MTLFIAVGEVLCQFENLITARVTAFPFSCYWRGDDGFPVARIISLHRKSGTILIKKEAYGIHERVTNPIKDLITPFDSGNSCSWCIADSVHIEEPFRYWQRQMIESIAKVDGWRLTGFPTGVFIIVVATCSHTNSYHQHSEQP